MAEPLFTTWQQALDWYKERVAQLEAALAAAKREHLVLEEDCWYSCPKSGQSCNDDADSSSCTCGADYHNAAIDRTLKGG